MDHPVGEFFDFFDRVKRNSKSNSMPSAHFHTHHELYYLVSGKAKYFVGSEIFMLSPGDFMFIPKNEYHKTEYLSSTEMERILIIFDEELVGEDYSEYIETLKRLKHIRVTGEDMHPFRSILRKIEEESTQKPERYVDMQKMYLKQLLILIGRHGHGVNQDLNETYTMIRDAARYISANCGKDLNLTDISNMYSLSPRHFSKQFKRVTGVGFKDYIIIARISAAKAMFDAGEKSVSRVASACGFNDSNYFTKVFRQMIGMPPKKYTTMV